MDLYEVLEIPENANETWILRAYELKKKAIEADSSLSDDERKRRIFSVDKAFNTLSDRGARERYDNRHVHVVEQTGAVSRVPTLVWIVLGTVLVIGAAVYWQYSSRMARERVELAERIDRERAEAERAQQAAARERGDAATDLALSSMGNPGDDAHRQALRADREREVQRYRDEAQSRNDMQTSARLASQAQQLNDANSRRLQVEQENQRRQAQADVDRQKRWLEQKAREEQIAADRQAAAARADQMRAQMEERRREEEERRRSRR
ncbi:MAG: DnaJ domain-containing protein [Betaproteobacteria bacterium]